MVSAIPICLLAIGLAVVSGHSSQSDAEFLDISPSDRRTFSHKKPVKVLPVFKKHKKFAGIIPHHVFGKAPTTEIIYQEAPKPIYKVHRYPGVEVKPFSDVSYSTPEPIIETHSIEHPVEDFVPAFSSDHSFPSGSGFSFYPEHDKPVFSSSSAHAPLPSPPKPVFSFVPAPPQPIFSPIPITSIPSPSFSISIPRPASNPVQPLPPVFAPIPAPFPSNPLPAIPASFPSNALPSIPVSFPTNQIQPQPILPFPIKVQVPVLPPLPAPTPTPSFSTVKIPAPQPVLPAPAQPVLPALPQPVLPALPRPVLPAAPQPVFQAPPQPILPAASPAPVLSSISTVSPTPAPALPPISVSLPSVQFSVVPSPLPPLPTFQPPIEPVTPEHEFPYPPSGAPIQPYIKDISLGDVEIKDHPLPTVEAPKYEEVTPPIADVGSHDLNVNGIKTGSGFFQKLKGWKADKVNTALSFAHFKPNPTFEPHPSAAPAELPASQVPSFPSLQLPAPLHPLPPAPATVFFPRPQFFPPPRYENFPPNNIESPPLLNSYGVPIPHDTYAPAHASHERLSSAASEERPSVVQAPAEKHEQNLEGQQSSQSPFQPQAVPHPVYVPEEHKTVKEDKNTTEEAEPEVANEPNPQEETPNALKYPNHKE